MEILISLLPFLVIFGVFWFFLIRPQQKQQKEHKEMLDNLKAGDNIITIGGIKGKIIKIKDNIIRLRVSSNVDIDVVRSSIGQLDNNDKQKENEKTENDNTEN
ncbi:MAG: preprotein translocase subunit YajC [Halanaerobiaceae bacterium]